MHCDACNSTEPVELPHVINDSKYVVEDKSSFVAFWEKQGLEPKPTLSETQKRFFKRELGLDFSDKGEK
jgi:hypothetical protein